MILIWICCDEKFLIGLTPIIDFVILFSRLVWELLARVGLAVIHCLTNVYDLGFFTHTYCQHFLALYFSMKNLSHVKSFKSEHKLATVLSHLVINFLHMIYQPSILFASFNVPHDSTTSSFCSYL